MHGTPVFAGFNPNGMIRNMESKIVIVHSDPQIMHGTPVFVGTRVPAETLWHYLEAGDSLNEFLMDFPSVTKQQAVCLLREAGEMLISGIRPTQQVSAPAVEVAP